jgi:hypothetical protein
VGRRTTHIYFLGAFRRPRGSLGSRFLSAALAPRVRIAPERSAFYRPKASALVGGRVSVPDLAPVELSALPGQTRPAFSRSASSLDGGPAVVRGGRIRRGRSQTRRAPPNRLSASRARWMRSTGRRRRPRPTSRRLMSAPLGWTGRAQRTMLGIDCQGLFSDRRAEEQVMAVTAALAREAAGEETASAGFAGRVGWHGGFGRI